MKKKGKFFAAMLAVALILCLATVALAACGDKNTQKHEHTFAEEWSHNDDYHWHAATCGHTDQVQDKASHDFDWQEVTPASCDQKGRKKGTCECGYVTYEDIEMTAHTLTPGWTWSGYTSATLKLTCTECEDVIATVPATLSSESGSDACAEYTLHTATATYDGETYTNSKREESVSHHTYALSEWKWDDDLSGAVAVLVCERDATHVYESARVSSEENDHLDPTCTENGYTDYKVRLELDGATYEGTKQNGGIQRKEIDTLGHDFDTEWLHNASEHWHKCSRCTETDAHIAHTYTDGICACGYAELTPEDEFVFSEIDGKWAITGYRGNRSVVTIPATYRGRDVVELGMGAFYGNTSLKHVVIPDAITSMRDGVFDGCVNIEEVTSPAIDLSSIPKDTLKKLTITSGTRIEAEQFKDYTQLAELSIAETVTYIGKDAFANTAWLNDKDGIVYINKILYTYIGETPENFELTIEDDTVAISPFAFEGKSIYQITISTDVPIDADAFKGTNLQRAILSPNALTSALSAIPKETLRYLEITKGTSGTTISQGALKDCIYLEELVLPFVGGSASASEASALFGYLFASVKPIVNENLYYEARQLYWNANSTSNTYVTYYIPKSIHTVTIKGGRLLNGTFSGCTGLTSITIPASVTSIADNAFSGCQNLQKIVVDDKNAAYQSKDGVLYKKGDKSIYHVPDSIRGAVEILDGCTSIGDYAFSSCTGLSEITIPGSVQSIGNYAFYYCTGLQTLTIGEGVTSIGEEAFSGCTGLKTVNWNATNCTKAGNHAVDDYTIFKGCTELATVNIGENVQSIPDDAFYKCTGLQTVTIGSGVTSIGDWAFRNCTGLKKVTIGEGVTSIREDAFYNCTGITKVNYLGTLKDWCKITFGGASANPLYGGNAKLYLNDEEVTEVTGLDGLESIPAYTFYGYASITSVTIPDSVTSIGSSAFNGCTGLQAVTIGNEVQSIGYSVFSGCTGLQTVTIGSGVTSIGRNAFDNCTELTEITIPDRVTSIGYSAFADCTGLSEITIPDSVTSIGYHAFADCRSLQTVTIGEGVQEMDLNAFSGCTGLQTVNWNATNCTKVGNSDYPIFNGCTGLTTVNIGENVQSIPAYAFRDCTGITKVNYLGTLKGWCEIEFSNNYANPLYVANYNKVGTAKLYLKDVLVTEVKDLDGLTAIPSFAFYWLTDITSVTIPNSVTSIGDHAFSDCTGLQTVTIGNGVQSIGDNAFYNCTGLQTVNWNATNCTEAGSYSNPIFKGCTGLTTVNIGENVQSIPACAFKDCTCITSVTIPDSVTSIGNYAFYDCTGLQTVTIGNEVQSIGEYAFWRCTGLTSITIPASVTSIGRQAFLQCTGLQTVTIGNGVQSIGDNAFYNCTGLTEIIIPDSVTSIGDWAFSGCTELTEITIPDSVTSIGSSAFNGCTGLQAVTIGNEVQSIGNSAFSGCSGLQTVTIGSGVTSIGQNAFDNCTGLSEITIPGSVQSIGRQAFFQCTGLRTVYYEGTSEQWNDISRGSDNDQLINANRYYFSEQPNYDGNHWHWNEETHTPELWAKQN